MNISKDPGRRGQAPPLNQREGLLVKMSINNSPEFMIREGDFVLHLGGDRYLVVHGKNVARKRGFV